MSYHMLPEWLAHKRTWMAWPCNPHLLEFVGEEAAYRAWGNTAVAISAFEPVTVVCNAEDCEIVREYAGNDVEIIRQPLGDSWMRDSGPTFVVDDTGKLGAVDWTFNGWGGRTFPDASADAEVAEFVAAQAEAERLPSRLVNEGGGIHVDGEGTLLVTESVQLNRNRNPNWTRAEVEAEMNRLLGTSKIIWVPRGLAADTDNSGTDGHIDTLACFARPGVVLVHHQPDPQHPDHEISKEITAIFKSATDARGRPFEVISLEAPQEQLHKGEALPCTYVNFSFVNGGLVMGNFNDPNDSTTRAIFEKLFPDRQIVAVDALPIFAGGGGVHCITQHEPLCASNGG